MKFPHLSLLALAVTLAMAPAAAFGLDGDACHGRRASLLEEGAKLLDLNARQLLDVDTAHAVISRLCSDNRNSHGTSPIFIPIGACENTYVEMVRALRAADSRVNEACDHLKKADERAAQCKVKGQRDCYEEAAKLYREVKARLEYADRAVSEGQAALDKARAENESVAMKYAGYLAMLAELYKQQRLADTERLRRDPSYVNPRGFGVPDETLIPRDRPELNPKAVTGDASLGDIFRKSSITGTVDERTLQRRAQEIVSGLDQLKRNGASTISHDPSRHAPRFGMLASQQLVAHARADDLCPILTTAGREIRAGAGGLDRMAANLDRLAATSSTITTPTSRPDLTTARPADGPRGPVTNPNRELSSPNTLGLGGLKVASAAQAVAESQNGNGGSVPASKGGQEARVVAASSNAANARREAAPAAAAEPVEPRAAAPHDGGGVGGAVGEAHAKAFVPSAGNVPEGAYFAARRPAASGAAPAAVVDGKEKSESAGVVTAPVAGAALAAGAGFATAPTAPSANSRNQARATESANREPPSKEALEVADKELAVLSKDHPIATESLRARLRARLARAAEERLREARERESGTSASVAGSVLRGATSGAIGAGGSSYRASHGGLADEETLAALASATTDNEVRRLLSDADEAAVRAVLGAPSVTLFERVHAAYQRNQGHTRVAGQ